jgi:hypothetical protein
MPRRSPLRRRTAGLAALTASVVSAAMFTVSPVVAAGADSDGDGMPNRWERSHGLNPHNDDDAERDMDRDRLRNLGEFRQHSLPGSQDTDGDGHDDGDEVRDGRDSTDVLDKDTDDDEIEDGDEDFDHDEVDNEDEDDANEACAGDDRDADADDVSDEDENENGTRVHDANSDDDEADDGEEDFDDDGEFNEDEDDSDDDECDGDRDGDGESDEDGDDRLGTIDNYMPETMVLTITPLAGELMSLQLSSDTEIEFDSSGSGSGGDGDFSDLRPGAEVAEVDIDDGEVEEIELVRAGSGDDD